MKVKILISIAGSNFSHAAGEEPDIKDEAEAKRWIAAGIAEKLKPAKKKATAKPAAPAAPPAEPPPTTPAHKKKPASKKAKK